MTSAESSPSRRTGIRITHWSRAHSLELAIAILVFVAAAPWSGSGLSNESPRVALSAALVENASVDITPYQEILFDDYSIREGRIYSDKAPGTSFVFAPVYVVAKVVGLDVLESTGVVKFLAKLVLSALPASLLAGLMVRRLRRHGARPAAASALMLSFGTLLLPFSTVAFGHVLSAALGLAAFSLFFERRSNVSTLLAGALVGMAVTVEYPMAIVGLTLLATILLTERRRLPWFVMGGFPFAVVLLGYHWLAFGNPLHTPYRYAAVFEGEFPGVGVGWPDLGILVRTLAGERGLFVLTPVVLVAVAGLFFVDTGQRQAEFRAGVGILIAFAVVPSIWVDEAAGAIGGYSPGPRFVAPALPFLAAPLASSFTRWRTLVIASAAVSVTLMTLATVTDPLAPDDQGTTALEHWLSMVRDGDFRQHVLVEAVGPIGLLVHFAIVATAGAAVLRVVGSADAGDP